MLSQGPKRVLGISHSTGDTQVIIASAREFAKKKFTVTLLAVGQAALNQLKQASFSEVEKNFIQIQDIDQHLLEKPIAENALSLTEAQIKKLTKELKVAEDFSAVLVGTPSYANVNAQCLIPPQLVTEFAPLLPVVVVSDYAFFDPDHLLSKERWFEKANKFLVPFKKAVTAFKADPNKTVVVGHPSIDDMKAKFFDWSSQQNKKSHIREKLSIYKEEKSVFVAAGKADDEAMIAALAEVCSAHPNVKIKIGLHPAAAANYSETLQKLIDDKKAAGQIGILPKGFITTDECVFAAEGVLTVSSTVGTTTGGATDKLVGFYQEGKEETDLRVPYSVGDYPNVAFYNSSQKLLTFLNKIDNIKALEPSSEPKRNQADKKAAENIAEAVESVMRVKN